MILGISFRPQLYKGSDTTQDYPVPFPSTD